MSVFKWTRRREKAALALARGYTEAEAAKEASVTDRTIRRWKRVLEFAIEVDRLSLMVDISSRAERLRLAMCVVRQKSTEQGKLDTNKDLLDWLKFAQSETDGIKLDLAAVTEAFASVADEGQGGTDNQDSDDGRVSANEMARLLRGRSDGRS